MKICQYQDCRHEVKPGSLYCKYHARMLEIEQASPKWLNDMIREIKLELERTEKLNCSN